MDKIMRVLDRQLTIDSQLIVYALVLECKTSRVKQANEDVSQQGAWVDLGSSGTRQGEDKG